MSHPGGNGGAKHADADIDGDGFLEIIALDRENRLFIFDGFRGFLKRIDGPYALGPSQGPGHVLLANLRGTGDRDTMIQTQDITAEYKGIGYYLNRTLIAVNLETGEELWRVLQDADPGNGIYEGYGGQAHGPAFCADVDGDGIDEVIGGTLIRTEGRRARIVSLGYPNHWVLVYPNRNAVDHFDATRIMMRPGAMCPSGLPLDPTPPIRRAQGPPQRRGVASPPPFSLSLNFPNPFNPETRLRYALPMACDVRMEIFTLKGQTNPPVRLWQAICRK